MPVYELRCTKCNHDHEDFRTYSLHGQWSPCPKCGAIVRQVISRPVSVHVDNMPRYICPATQKPITSRKQRNESFARHGLMDANDLGQPTGPKYKPLEHVEPGGGLGAGGGGAGASVFVAWSLGALPFAVASAILRATVSMN